MKGNKSIKTRGTGTMNTTKKNTTSNDTDEIYFDPYREDLANDPYPMFRRLRENAPLYYNDVHKFYALSRYEDVQKGLSDHETFISARGNMIEIIRDPFPMPDGFFMFEDPPLHTAHRRVLGSVFTPGKMNALESKIREYCAQCLDKRVGEDKLDFIADLGAEMPMRVIGMMLGIPEADLTHVREHVDAGLRSEAGKPIEFSAEKNLSGDNFAEYIDWRIKNPSDDLMTALLNSKYVDIDGTRKLLNRDQVLQFVTLLAAAGNETTSRMIGWMGYLLGEHPEQLAELVRDRSLIPNAVEEALRFQPPGTHFSRYVTRDVEYYGQTVPAGSIMMFVVGAANRDDRRFPAGDRFDIHRDTRGHLAFGHGIHTCIGAALTRVEGRVAFEEILARFPHWEVDKQNARLASSSIARGWETLPVFIR